MWMWASGQDLQMSEFYILPLGRVANIPVSFCMPFRGLFLSAVPWTLFVSRAVEHF